MNCLRNSVRYQLQKMPYDPTHEKEKIFEVSAERKEAASKFFFQDALKTTSTETPLVFSYIRASSFPCVLKNALHCKN